MFPVGESFNSNTLMRPSSLNPLKKSLSKLFSCAKAGGVTMLKTKKKQEMRKFFIMNCCNMGFLRGYEQLIRICEKELSLPFDFFLCGNLFPSPLLSIASVSLPALRPENADC
ncbi:MAG: hypothetical protein HQM13_16060 [SAR324 cluster bacterium]|nr:hypothetical protein [SAR324 cluster bacterium]